MAPTAAPTAAPTPAPTPHPCNDDTHECDKSPGGICYEQGDDSYTCGCRADRNYYEATPYVPGSSAAHLCKFITPAPTPSPTAFPTPAPTPCPSLVSFGYSPEVLPLEHCHGDCDHDGHCQFGYKCHANHDFSQIPGCVGTPEEAMDYCVKDQEVYAACQATPAPLTAKAVCNSHCTKVYAPVVCASNGDTYANSCEANCDGARNCAASAATTTTTTAASSCFCTKIYAPVMCGNGKTYDNSCTANCDNAVACALTNA
jgi:hypothetical protein